VVTEAIQKAMDELGEAVTGLQVKHRGRIILLHPAKEGDPRGKWATAALVDCDDEGDELVVGYGETITQALDDAATQADELEEHEAEERASIVAADEGEDE
jgi:hypothetical protein